MRHPRYLVLKNQGGRFVNAFDLLHGENAHIATPFGAPVPLDSRHRAADQAGAKTGPLQPFERVERGPTDLFTRDAVLVRFDNA